MMKNSIRVGMLVGSTALLGSLAHADQVERSVSAHQKHGRYRGRMLL